MPTTAEILGFTPAGPALTTAGILAVARKKPPIQPGDVFSKTPGEAASPVPAIAAPAALSTRVANPAAEADRKKSVLERVASTLAQIPSSIRQTGAKVFTPEAGTKSVLADVPVAGPVLETAAGLVVAPAQYAYEAIPHALAALAKPQGEREIALARALLPATARAMDEPTAENITAAVAEAVMLGAPFVKGLKGLGGKATPAETAPVPPSAFEPGAKLTIPIPGEAKVPVVAPEAPKSVYDYYNEPRKPGEPPPLPPQFPEPVVLKEVQPELVNVAPADLKIERRAIERRGPTLGTYEELAKKELPAVPAAAEAPPISELPSQFLSRMPNVGKLKTKLEEGKTAEPVAPQAPERLKVAAPTDADLAARLAKTQEARRRARPADSQNEPWQMTSVEFWKRGAGGKAFEGRGTSDFNHKSAVREARAEGKPVPPEVLAQYPDLAPKPAPIIPRISTRALKISLAQKAAGQEGMQLGLPEESAKQLKTASDVNARREYLSLPKGLLSDLQSGRQGGASKVAFNIKAKGRQFGLLDEQGVPTPKLEQMNKMEDAVKNVGVPISEYTVSKSKAITDPRDIGKNSGWADTEFPHGRIFAGKVGNQDVYTNGHILVFDKSPVATVAEAKEMGINLISPEQTEQRVPDFEAVIPKGEEFPAKPVAFFPGKGMNFKDTHFIVLQRTDGVFTTVDSKYYDAFLQKYPGAEFKQGGKLLPSSQIGGSAVSVFQKGKRVGLIMPIEPSEGVSMRVFERFTAPKAGKVEKLPPTVKTAVETKVGGGEMASQLIPEVPGKAVPSPTKTAELIGRSDISRFLQEKLAVPIRTGRFRGKWGGIFKRSPKVVRSRVAGDLTTIAHEVGHFLDDKFGIRKLRPEGTKSWRVAKQNPIFKELDHLGDSERPDSYSSWKPYRGLDYKIGEGVAEFTRYYLHDPAKAQELAPNLYKQFSRILDANPEVKTALNQAQTDIKRYMEQPSVAKVLSQISISEREAGSTIGDKLQAFYTATIDALAPIKRAEKEMMGGKAPERVTESAYELGTLFLKGWMSKATSFIRRGAFNVNLETVGPGLEQILKPVGGQLDNLRVYMVSKRALELRARGKNPGISSVDARQAIKELETPEMAKAFEQIKAFQDNSVQYLVDSGILSEKVAKEMRKLNQEYVPFYRVFEQEVPAGVGGKRIANLWSPIKRIKGSGREIIDPLESIVKNVYAYVNLADRNRVAQAFVRNAERVGGAGRLIEQLPTPQHAVSFSLEEIRDALQKAGIEVMSGEMTDIASVFRPNAMAPKGENILTVFHGGDRTFYQVEPTLYRAFLALDNEGMNTLVKILSIPAKLLRAGATLTPEFVVRNPVRDQFTAFIQSKYGYVPGWDFVKGMYHAIAKTDTYLKFERSGALHSILVQMDRDYLQSTLRDIEGKRKLVKYFNPVAGLRILSEYGELGTRVGEFARGIKKEGPGLEGTLRAGRSAQEVTVNFSRTGAKTQALNSLIAFWNATVQADVRAARAFKENPMRTSLKVAAGITTPSVLLYMVNRKNEAYKRLPQWQKDLFWMIPVGKETFIRIPKPFEMGILFGTVPERALQWLDQNDPEAFSGLANQILEGLLPSLIPTAVLPAVEGYANRSVFTGKPIVPKGMEGLSPELQARPTTSPTARAIGRAVGVSPLKIESGIRSTTGGLGTTTLRGLDLAGQALRLYSRQPTEPGTSLTRIPGVKGFIAKADVGSSDTMDRFYGDYTKGETLIADYRELLKRGEREKAIALRRSEDWRRLVTVGARGGFVGRLAGVARQLSELRQERTRLLNNKFIDEEARRRRLELNRRRTFTAVEGYQRRIGR